MVNPILRESEFTGPMPECPHPDRWHAMDSESTEVEVTELVAAFVKALRPDHVLETGSSHGFTTAAIGAVLAEAGQGHLISLEVVPELVAEAQGRCQGLPVTVLRQSSMDYTPDGPLDFVWFDSLLHLRAKEFLRFYPFFHSRTVVGFHDTGPQHQPLRSHIETLANGGLLHPIFLPTPRGVSFGRVIGGTA